jgi:hypothetical protein
MFNLHDANLGAVGDDTTSDSGSFWTSLSNVVASGTKAGLSLYNQVQTIKSQKNQANAMQQYAQALQSSYGYGYSGVPGIPARVPGNASYVAPGFFSGGSSLMWPLLLGGGAVIIGFIIYKQKFATAT